MIMLKAKKDLNYWKKKLLSVLKGDVIEKSLQDILYPGTVLKAIEEDLLIKARGFAVGTIRTWQGKDYKKLSSGKWMRTYTGTGERGERQAVRNVMRAIQGAKSMEELAEIVNKNMQRFKDESGKTLPIVKEFMITARGTESGKKEENNKWIKNIELGQSFTFTPKDKTGIHIKRSGVVISIDKNPDGEVFRFGIKGQPNLFVRYYKSAEKGEKEKVDEKKTEGIDKIKDKIKDKYQKSDKMSGDEDTIYVGKEELQGQWKLVEADSPSASHDETTFNRTKGFPTNEDGSTINDRDYEKDKAAQEIVNSVASEFDGRALSFDSPVVVTQDGIVVSGNNRTMSSKIAARKGTDKKYIEALERRAKKFGFSPDDMKKFENPRVIFEIDNKEAYSTERFARFNVKEIKAMSPIETAVKMSKLMKIETIKGIGDRIQEFDTLAEMYADKKATTEIFNTLQRGKIITEFNRPQYITEDGVTAAGKEFLETVMVGSVVSEANIRALNKAKSVRKKLVKAISQLVQNKSMGGYSISNEINQAIDVVMQVKASGDKFKSVDDFAKQSDMFQKKNNVAIELAKKLELKERDFADFMQKMNANLGEGASGQTDIFFGDVESKDQVLSRMLDLKKSLLGIFMRKSKGLEYWKKKLLAILKDDTINKSLQDILYAETTIGIYEETLLLKAKGFAVGTIREWSGKKYKKLSSGKWMRTYSGTGDRGEKQATRNVMRKIQSAKSMSELAGIVKLNMERFKDLDGKTLPIVKEFLTASRETGQGKKKIVVKKEPVKPPTKIIVKKPVQMKGSENQVKYAKELISEKLNGRVVQGHTIIEGLNSIIERNRKSYELDMEDIKEEYSKGDLTKEEYDDEIETVERHNEYLKKQEDIKFMLENYSGDSRLLIDVIEGRLWDYPEKTRGYKQYEAMLNSAKKGISYNPNMALGGKRGSIIKKYGGGDWNDKVYGRKGNYSIFLSGDKKNITDDEAQSLR